MRMRQRPWAVRPQDAESIVAEARKALFVMVGVLVLLWIIQLANIADHYQITVAYGIRPRDPGSLPDILTAPFLHVSWTHIESNSGPLFIFGFLAAYRGVRRFAALSVLVIIVSGLAEWFTGASGTVGAGASGVVFGYLGYILVRGFFDRRPLDIVLGAVMALCFAYQFTVLLPHAGIGWQAHIGGLAGLVGHLDVLTGDGRPVVHGPRAPRGAPGLYFTGYTNPVSGMLRELACDARRIARAVARAAH